MGKKKTSNSNNKKGAAAQNQLYWMAALVLLPLVIYYSIYASDDDDDGEKLIGKYQKISSTAHKEAFRRTVKYIKETVLVDDYYPPHVKEKCKLTDSRCVQWAVEGRCESLEKWTLMDHYCAAACQRCEVLDPELKCQRWNDPATMEPRAFSPGSIQKIFERLASLSQYKPQVLSRPSDSETEADGEPWVLILDDFLSPEECNTMIQVAEDLGFKRSLANKATGSKVASSRTSTTAWCKKEKCWSHPTYKRIRDRIASVLEIPSTNYAPFQFLHYTVGQFYSQHHDYLPHQRGTLQGVRTLTVFMYLNDVEKGGGTRFPLQNITVDARAGRVLIWPSVQNDKPGLIDARTRHEALAPESGIKYAVNAWIHEGNAQEAFFKDCNMASTD